MKLQFPAKKIGVFLLIFLLVYVGTPKVWALDSIEEDNAQSELKKPEFSIEEYPSTEEIEQNNTTEFKSEKENILTENEQMTISPETQKPSSADNPTTHIKTNTKQNIIQSGSEVKEFNGFKYIENSDGTIKITDYTGNQTDITIPATIEGKNVTIIGEDAFFDKGLTSVFLPNTVVIIEDLAFSNNSIQSVHLGENIEYIGEQAFTLNKIANVEIPASVKTIGKYVFAYNQITSVNFKGNIETIGIGMFRNNNLEEIVIPSSVKKIEDNAFLHNELKKVTLGDKLEFIGEYAFSNNDIKEIIFPDSLLTIGKAAFNSNKLQDIKLPPMLTTINEDTFYENQITNVTLGDKVETIGKNAFRKNQINTIELPTTITTIGDNAFAENKLISIELGDTIQSIGEGAFSDNLLKTIEIPSSIKTIEASTFYKNKIETVTFGEKLESIGYQAFYENQIQVIEFPSSLKTIEQFAFGENKLVTVIFGEKIETIKGGAFNNNPTLKYAIFKNDVDNLGINFLNNDNLSSSFSIYGIKGSNVETYAENNGINFEDIDKLIQINIQANGSNNQWIKNTSIAFDITSVFELKELKYAWSQSTITPENDKWQVLDKNEKINWYTDGNWYLHIFAEDQFGFEKHFISNVFKLDKSPPTVQFESSIPDKWQLSGSMKVSVFDNESGIKEKSLQYTWSTSPDFPKDAKWTNFKNGELIEKKGVNGIWYLFIQAEDQAGNTIKVRSEAFHLLKLKEITIEADNSVIQVYPGTLIKIKGTNVSVLLPDDLPEGTTLQVKPAKVKAQGFKQAGDIYNFIFTFPKGSENYKGKFVLTLGVNEGATNPAIYYFNEQTNKLERIGGTVKGNTITSEVNHFSTYGVFTEKVISESAKSIAKDSNKTEGTLPKTATTIYNWLVLGGVLIIFGIFIANKARRKEV